MLKCKRTDFRFGGINMEKKTWKTIAIIFVILFFLETVFVITLASYGIKEIDRETECTVECENDDQCTSYFYDTYDRTCELYGVTNQGTTHIITKIIE